VDPVRGILRASVPLELYAPVYFVEEVRKKLGTDLPIMTDNDANCCCYGELASSPSERPENFLFVLAEQRKHTVKMDNFRIIAVGLGLFLNGRVHHGADFSAGEFRSIMYKQQQINQFSLTDEKAVQFLQNPQVNSIIVQELTAHIAFLINTLNLGKVVIGGPVEVLAEEITSTLQTKIKENWAYPQEVKCSISFSRLGENAAAFGAAAMILEHFIAIPEVLIEESDRPLQGMDLVGSISLDALNLS